jgi:non-specific serine/threonine protein kinase
VLTHLVDKSLVLLDEESVATRYRMLETIREYALEKLAESGESEAIRAQHLEYFVRLAEEAESKFFTAEQTLWFNRFEAERDNVRIALTWAPDAGQLELGLRLAAALVTFWGYRGYHVEGMEMLQSLLTHPLAARTLARAKALYVFSALHSLSGNSEQAAGNATEALAIGQALSDAQTTAGALHSLGMANANLGNAAEARPLHEQALAMFRALDHPLIGRVLWGLGLAALRAGDHVEATRWFAEAGTLTQSTGNKVLASVVMRH